MRNTGPPGGRASARASGHDGVQARTARDCYPPERMTSAATEARDPVGCGLGIGLAHLHLSERSPARVANQRNTVPVKCRPEH